jgi:hypothetical protein
MRAAITGLLILLIAVPPAHAWNSAGHKIIASIAFRQLSREEQSRVVAILKRHPRFTPDFTDEMPAEVRAGDEAAQNEWLFQQAAVWPDIVRSGPDARTAFHRPTWHYVNQPHFLSDKDRAALDGRLAVNVLHNPPAGATIDTQDMNIVQAIKFGRDVCADKQSTPEARALMLAWLFHTIGDAHQPLHSAALFSERLFPEGDRGGNLTRTIQERNVHALWDNFPGADSDFRAARNKAIALAADPKLAELGRSAPLNLNHKAWLDESYLLAVTVAYDAEIITALRGMERGSGGVESIRLSEDYLKAGGRNSERRLVQAGFRLGVVLKGIVAE